MSAFGGSTRWSIGRHTRLLVVCLSMARLDALITLHKLTWKPDLTEYDWLELANWLEREIAPQIYEYNDNAPVVLDEIANIVAELGEAPTNFKTATDIAYKACTESNECVGLEYYALWVQCRAYCGLNDTTPIDATTVEDCDEGWLTEKNAMLGFVFDSMKIIPDDYQKSVKMQRESNPQKPEAVVKKNANAYALLEAFLRQCWHWYVRRVVDRLEQQERDRVLCVIAR